MLSRLLCVLALSVLMLPAVPGAAPSDRGPHAQTTPGTARVLRYAFPVAETGFDPPQISDLYSATMIAHIFDSPLQYDYLARPARLRAATAAALPEVSADGMTIRVTLRPGIHFADDPAFKGQRRELTAHDYVYSIKRHFDPRWRSSSLGTFEDYLVGLRELRAEALRSGRFDYDTEVQGLRAIDRYTFEMRLLKPNFVLVYALADCRATCAVAREVIEAYGDKIMEHPVGTGPFRLSSWKRSSRLIFERNPTYRDEVYDAVPPPGDPRLQEVADRLRGRRLPMLDRVEIDIVEEAQPRWLAFLNNQHDLIEMVPNEFALTAFPGDRLAAYLARRGVRMERYARIDLRYTFFNWADPVVGGPQPERVALRRAISLGYNSEDDLRILRRNQALPAHGLVPPGAAGHDPDLRSDMNTYSPARARALLDLYGYTDRDGDGYREQPDGRPLSLEFATGNDQSAKQVNELWKRSMDGIGIRLAFKRSKWPEQLKAARAGKLQMWSVGSSSSAPDAESTLSSLYGPNTGRQNLSRFDLPEFNRLYDQMVTLPDGSARNELIRNMTRLALAYRPWKVHVHSISTDLTHPRVIGWTPHPVMRRRWDYIDVAPEANERTGTQVSTGSR
ncbi:MAG TPA: ABC transporter substrate-binding protein [Burkholderiaceae bacterium]|nr:ABC transporter substrate-binding protein [Burkholderiaceae bacterium]